MLGKQLWIIIQNDKYNFKVLKNEKKDMIKIKGMIGIFLFCITIVYTKVSTIYNFDDGNPLFIGMLLLAVIVISIFLAYPYINRLVMTGK